MQMPPRPTVASNRRGERVNYCRAVPARTPHAASLHNAMAENTTRSTSICAVTELAELETISQGAR